MDSIIKKSPMLTRKQAAEILKTNPAALEIFERKYASASDAAKDPDDIFDVNSREAAATVSAVDTGAGYNIGDMEKRIINELLAKTPGYMLPEHQDAVPVTAEEIADLPESLRPQLTGSMMHVDINSPSYLSLLYCLQASEKPLSLIEKRTEASAEAAMKKRASAYQLFRVGLDTLDLDPVTYEILGMNRLSIGYWLPKLTEANRNCNFFYIPETKVVKVPLPILQLTRMDYFSLTPMTIDIVNKWAFEAFQLDETKSYFIKTGTYSSKFDFRNCKVTSAKEVRELGSYLLYIHFQANCMAHFLTAPHPIYGASTTNEWCVREYIEDEDKPTNPTIYHGLPLHTEYRVFVDCDNDEIIGITPYWRPDVMENRFDNSADSDNPDNVHDSIIFKAHKETLMKRYNENKDTVLAHVNELLPYLDLTGQWSIDIMQNGNKFWLIDMATADHSALNDCVPTEKLKQSVENWIPELAA